MEFATPTDVTDDYEGLSPPLPPETRLQSLIDIVSARLRLLLPDLETRIADDATGDLAVLARDAVVQATIRRARPGGQQVQSETQQAGPFQTTQRFTVDRAGIFYDDDLDLLRGGPAVGFPLGTIRIGRPDWSRQ